MRGSGAPGSGKTTTLKALALARPNLRILYLAFNVTVRDEAMATFPSNCEAKTLHQVHSAPWKRAWRTREGIGYGASSGAGEDKLAVLHIRKNPSLSRAG